MRAVQTETGREELRITHGRRDMTILLVPSKVRARLARGIRSITGHEGAAR
jgi:hypothetical protein